MVSETEMKGNVTRVLRLETYWLIVRDKSTGEVKNARVVDKPKNELAIQMEFERKYYPKYEVLDIGVGEENRPEELSTLPYID